MNNKRFKQIIRECIRDVLLDEGWYTDSATLLPGKGKIHREIGSNPLITDMGNHSARETVPQSSTIDWNGQNFDGEHKIVSDNKFTFYKVKNFGNPDINSTMDFFKDIKDFRKVIDILNGATRRNGRGLIFKTITPESKVRIAERNQYMSYTFWEFSFDGNTWYIYKPNAIQNLTPSKCNF